VPGFSLAAAMRRVAAFAACVCLLLAPVWAVATPAAGAASLNGSNALNELTEGQPETTTTASTSTSSAAKEESSSNSKPVVLLAIGAAVLLLGGIVFVIMRDVRRVAPAGDVEMAEATLAHDAAVRARKRRAKAKAARQQRKRNRR
jgi:hypothetical protein